jgi:predicted metal-dependent phosphotriesterase family hydrolase
MKIQTVRGEIPPSQLGITSCHEHLLWVVPAPFSGGDPDLGFEDINQAVSELQYFSEAGGNAVVEMTTSEIGRNPQALKSISEKTNVHIIAASGHHKDKFSAASLRGRSVDQIAQGIITDIMVGMDGTSIKAGVIKAATSHQEATESERRVIHAIGLAHLTTKTPVSTHTEEGTFALEQIDLLTQAGVSADHLLIGHLDRDLPMDTYLEIADRGVWMGFDQIGKTKYWADEERAKLIYYLFQHGYGGRMLLSGDTARKSARHAFNPVVDGMAHMLMGFKKLLLGVGLNEEHLEQMLVKNPAVFFAF